MFREQRARVTHQSPITRYDPPMASILIIGPHPDDQELGMGGTIVKLVKQGHKVHLVDMTNGEPTPLGSPEIRASESAAAAKVLGVERTLLGLTNRAGACTTSPAATSSRP